MCKGHLQHFLGIVCSFSTQPDLLHINLICPTATISFSIVVMCLRLCFTFDLRPKHSIFLGATAWVVETYLLEEIEAWLAGMMGDRFELRRATSHFAAPTKLNPIEYINIIVFPLKRPKSHPPATYGFLWTNTTILSFLALPENWCCCALYYLPKLLGLVPC